MKEKTQHRLKKPSQESGFPSQHTRYGASFSVAGANRLGRDQLETVFYILSNSIEKHVHRFDIMARGDKRNRFATVSVAHVLR